MLEFDTVCYLENQKTGSTYVERFLRAHMAEPIRQQRQHKPVLDRRAGVFYFTNVREPLDLYLSLFNYGLDGYGRVRMRMMRMGLLDYFDDGIAGFDRWLRFALSPEFGGVVPAYGPHAAKFGLATHRFQRLSRFEFSLEEDALDAVLRAETLGADLAALVDGPLGARLRDPAAARAWLARDEVVNTSSRQDRGAEVAVSAAALRQLLDRDAYLYDRFYPDSRDRLRRAADAAGEGAAALSDLIAA